MLRNQQIPFVITPKSIRVINNSNCCGLVAFNFKYLKTYTALLKILQLVVGSLCKTILLNFGLKYASILGFSYDAFVSTVSASMITTSIILIIYILSEKSSKLIRASLFEIFFNGSICIDFLGTCSWLMLSVYGFLSADLLIPFFVVYPIIAVNVLGFTLGILYAIDCYLAYKYFKGYN